MNFLAQVLTTASETQMHNVKKDIPKIKCQIDKLKCEVKTYMTDSHINLNLMKKKSNDLLEDSNMLNNEMTELRSQIEILSKMQINDCKDDILNLGDELNEADFALKIINQLVRIEELLNGAKDYLNNRQYFKSIENINTIDQILKDIPADECLDIIQAIHVSVRIEHGTILNEAKKVWKETVVTEKEVNENEVTLSIKINNSTLDEVVTSMQTLYLENSFIFEALANFLMKEVFTSIIDNQCKIETNNFPLYSVLIIKIIKNSNKMTYDEVFNNINFVIEFLNLINFELNTDLLFLGFIGQKVGEEFCEHLIKHYLADTIPSSPEGLKQYNIVTEQVKCLQTQLTECQFLNKENESILEYANNVHVLFANKTCQEYLEKARIILKKDLHNMIEVGTEIQPGDNSANNIHIFPKCYISRNVNDYLDLVRKILDQANTSSDMCAGRLVLTADQIIGLYYELIPEYHKKLLETIPQQVALFYNNCIYIAHELLNLNKYQKDRTANRILREQLFANHFQLLRTIGTTLFSNYMKSQIKQVEDILQESDFMKLQQTDKIDPKCEKSIRQCLRQLELLKTVWQKVLTYEMYNKSIGELLNSFVELLIKLVIGVEDISTDNCTLLVEVYNIVKNRAPKLFTEQKEINLYVKRWYKFNELILLLNSNLTDINDRWADGKGPLAMEFNSIEVKGLIRALFQNTDRRSAILARIN